MLGSLEDVSYICNVNTFINHRDMETKKTITREEAVKRWKLAKQQKKACVERIIANMTEKYVRTTGKQPKGFTVW